MYQLNNVPNNIIELSHSKLSDNAVLSIARRIAMFKNNDALEPTHHICSLIAEASVRLTAVTDVTTAVSSIRIQLTLHVLNTRMILGLSVLLPDTNTISYHKGVQKSTSKAQRNVPDLFTVTVNIY